MGITLANIPQKFFDVLTENKDIFARKRKKGPYLHQFKYAEKIGLGRLDYKLVEV